MKKTLSIFLFLTLLTGINAQRFPKPDFESGYQYPELHYAVPAENLWTAVDIFLLVALLCITAWSIVKKRRRKPVIWVSICSVAYFGFFRKGCICSVGAVQNAALALTDASYVMPLSAWFFFVLPLVFTFLFGRIFCAGVCPLGAIQELVNIKNYRISKSIATVLEILPWIYLIFALLYAITGSRFIICRFDPFIGIFRLGGDAILIAFGVLLLLTAIFTGRPFCRFLCPYGALLRIFARFSIWKIRMTEKSCNNCELCHNACPVDAIQTPFDNKIKETRMQGVRRMFLYFTVLPIAALAGALLLRQASSALSSAHKDVRLYDMVMQHEAQPQDVLSVDLEAFYGQGGDVEMLKQRYIMIQQDFSKYSTIAGALIGLVVGMTLISLSLKRTRTQYDINHAACINCGRCFSYCPQNKIVESEMQTT